LNKYEPIELNKIKQKPRYTHINKTIERFDPKVSAKEKNSPSSATYDVMNSI